jgi:electron-transferring-flavoprotein dehydrogenase
MDADVVIIGGGPAGLSTAYHLGRLIQDHNHIASERGLQHSILSPSVLLLEKGADIGAHSFSGAVMDPVALREMIPDWLERGVPLEGTVHRESLFYLLSNGQIPFPFLPSTVRNIGNDVLSLSKFCRWLGQEVAALGVQIFPGFPVTELLLDGKTVIGVRTGDQGIDREGKHKPNFNPGIDIHSKVSVIAEGPRGTLTRTWMEHLGLGGRYPQVFELGVKEVFEMPPGRVHPGEVIHTIGYPLDSRTSGGGFLYTLGEDHIALGMVVSFDSPDPLLNPHEALQRLKAHPLIRDRLREGRSLYSGAKVISAGGHYTIPQLYTDGALLVGESASLVNMTRLKGIHLALKSGMMAAETILEALKKGDFTAGTLVRYDERLRGSYVGEELYRARNFHQALSQGGVKRLVHLGLQFLTGGRGIMDPMEIRPDHAHTQPYRHYYGREAGPPNPPVPKDGAYLMDKVTGVHHAGVLHEENQPSHLKIIDPRTCLSCWEEYHSPCIHFCPADVYEMVVSKQENPLPRLHVRFINCLHCKSCDIKCPHLNIRWTLPEGGGGPRYTIQ